MEELIKLLSISNFDTEQYVKSRILTLNSQHNDVEEISLVDGEIYHGWINTDVPYLPSGNRSKGFKLTEQFYIDFCNKIKKDFKNFDITVVKSKFNSDRLMQWINLYISEYFGQICDDASRKEIFGYGKLDSIGETLNIESLKGESVARCIEKAAGLNGLANFMGIDSSLVLSEATRKNTTVGHAYCLINQDGKYQIYDPTFLAKNSAEKTVPYIFDFNIDNIGNKVVFNPSEYGAVDNAAIEYDFPWNKLKTQSLGHKKTITPNDIATADKEASLSTGDIENKKGFFNKLLDKLKGKGER